MGCVGMYRYVGRLLEAIWFPAGAEYQHKWWWGEEMWRFITERAIWALPVQELLMEQSLVRAGFHQHCRITRLFQRVESIYRKLFGAQWNLRGWEAIIFQNNLFLLKLVFEELSMGGRSLAEKGHHVGPWQYLGFVKAAGSNSIWSLITFRSEQPSLDPKQGIYLIDAKGAVPA